MLGCIQPMSSPMMKRMFGFCPCCYAEAGTLAIVVAVLNTTRAHQIALNLLIVIPYSMLAAELRPQPSPAPPAEFMLMCASSSKRSAACAYTDPDNLRAQCGFASGLSLVFELSF